jgi:hypothetical protein
MKLADIDIDFRTDINPKKLFPWTRASIVKDDELRPHPCGYYPQTVPIDPVTGLCAIPYKEAEQEGFTKIDFLHLGLLDSIETRQEIDAMLAEEPDWGLLQMSNVHPKLFQLAKHGELLKIIKPTCIEELADVLALIRPGKKQYIKLYKTNRESVRKVLWTPDENGYHFKKSHGIAYAMNIVLQLHLIEAGLL